jgi:uncharacterized protein YfaS (alpha-2-macroglobulin family)
VCTSNGYPNIIAYKSCQASCTEQSCGAYKYGRILIEIKDSDGSTITTYSTRTDAKGRFSYTFTAPSTEGRYAAVVRGDLS